MRRTKFRVYRQNSSLDCGPACLRMILSAYNHFIPAWDITETFPLCADKGWSVETFIRASEHYGLNVEINSFSSELLNHILLPVVMLIKNHYVVIYRVTKRKVFVADPAMGGLTYSFEEFLSIVGSDSILLAISPVNISPTGKPLTGFSLIMGFWRYYLPYKRYLYTILWIGVIMAIVQMILPFISRTIIDVGIQTSSYSFLQLILIGMAVLTLSLIIGNFIQVFLFSHISNRVKSSMLNEYFKKILKLKYIHFLTSNCGDLMQRATDIERIQNFVVNSLLSMLISCLFLLVYYISFAILNLKFGCIALTLSVIYMGWNLLFIKERKKIDFKFWNVKCESNRQLVDAHSNFFDLLTHKMQNILLKRWKSNLLELYKQNSKYLIFNQIQDVGSKIIIQSMNMILTFLCCYYVVEGQITLGSLFAIQYLIGSLSFPLSSIADFFSQAQLTMISLNRIESFYSLPTSDTGKENTFLPKHRDIILAGVSYRSPDGKGILNQVFINFKEGKKYGIIGPSGSGKSTLLKIIAGIIIPSYGDYKLGGMNTLSLCRGFLKKSISVCLQECSLFRGTIIENVIGELEFEEDRFFKVLEISAIRREMESLKDGFRTVVGDGTIRLSHGQVQRLLIARALYKRADIYIFDEITNTLDSVTGLRIISKIDEWLIHQTRIYVTHQLEGIKDAEFIYSLNSGFVAGAGTWHDLMSNNNLNEK
ncbi:MAG: ATP-binding cassette domain-containing protein [Bacteroides sp.]|nr:ATP-binding cassette domain-containing protein [Bacteroides sp.]